MIIQPAFLQEILCFSMKLIDFAFKAHFSPAFLPEIPPGIFLFLPEISNFTLRQFLHEKRNVAILIYKYCIWCTEIREICPDSSNVWSRVQVVIFVKRHCTGVNLVEEG